MSRTIVAPAHELPPAGSKSAHLSRGARAWAIYQGARDPSNMVINIYIFMPYFASVVVGNPVAGQAAVAQIGTASGWIIALTAPLLGVALDRLGPRKPWLAAITVAQVLLLASLWFVAPGGLPLVAAQLLLIAIGVLFNWGDVLFGALLPVVAAPRETGRVSALAASLGNDFSVGVLVVALLAFALPGKIALPFLPSAPLLGLDPALHEPERITGALVALVFAVGSVGLFLWSRDAVPSGVSFARTLGGAPSSLLRTLKGMRGDRDGMIFLIARMLYTDGLATLMLFTGVYAAGVLGWGALDLLTFGIAVSLAAALGALAAGRLDEVLGPRIAIQLEVVGCLIGAVAQLGMGPGEVLYFAQAKPPMWNGPIFQTLPSLLYLVIGLFTSACIAATFASSRTMLVRIAPAERVGTYFGLFALSGQATAWLGPLLVGVLTTAFASQRVGFAAVTALMALGLVGMHFVRSGERLA